MVGRCAVEEDDVGRVASEWAGWNEGGPSPDADIEPTLWTGNLCHCDGETSSGEDAPPKAVDGGWKAWASTRLFSEREAE